MGNRAVVIFHNTKAIEGESAAGTISPAVYLHWNGGPESVYAFLGELARWGIRRDAEYRCARFVQIVGQYLAAGDRPPANRNELWQDNHGHTESLGVMNGPSAITARRLEPFNPGDNGVYVVSEDRVRRFTLRGRSKVGGPLSPRAVAVEWDTESMYEFVEWDAKEVLEEEAAAMSDARYGAIRADLEAMFPAAAPNRPAEAATA